jgi:myo-inositol-1(or 4)-monophosphatase
MFSPAFRPGFDRLRQGARRVTWGGDCYAYGLVALGLIDVVAESDLQIWDWAALVPVIEGAGGRVTDWSGAPLHPGSDGRVIALGDARLLSEAVQLLRS